MASDVEVTAPNKTPRREGGEAQVMGGFPKEKQKFYTEFMPSLLAPTRVVTSSHAREHRLLTTRNRISRYLLRAIKDKQEGDLAWKSTGSSWSSKFRLGRQVMSLTSHAVHVGNFHLRSECEQAARDASARPSTGTPSDHAAFYCVRAYDEGASSCSRRRPAEP